MTGLHLMQLEVEVSDIRWQYPLIIVLFFEPKKMFWKWRYLTLVGDIH